MRLSSVIKDMDCLDITGSLNHDITSIEYHSKHVRAGSIFIAVSGFITGGYHFIQEALNSGAVAIVTEQKMDINTNVTIITVPNARKAMACAAANFHSHPSERLNMIGITGTNGKTSVTHFIRRIFNAAQIQTSLIGTMGTIINNDQIESNLTTPEAPELQALLKQVKNQQGSTCVMEVSSHALELERVAYTSFNTAVFTNLTPDHLEMHGDMENYFQAKAKLFTYISDFAIVNNDDAYGRKLKNCIHRDMLITYGIHHQAHIYPSGLSYTMNGSTYIAHTPIGNIRVNVHLPGEIYVYNSLAAIACAVANGISLEAIQTGVAQVSRISGRMETIYKDDDFRVIIDFAHTEDALKQTLTSIKPYVKGRLILVFGVYADTSINGRMKRFGMGKVAAEYADYTVITLDNPKQHDQDMIIQETSEALKVNSGTFTSIKDRKQAIYHAIRISHSNDTILLAGKGHENTQIIGNEEIPFNEEEIVMNAIKDLKPSESTSY